MKMMDVLHNIQYQNASAVQLATIKMAKAMIYVKSALLLSLVEQKNVWHSVHLASILKMD